MRSDSPQSAHTTSSHRPSRRLRSAITAMVAVAVLAGCAPAPAPAPPPASAPTDSATADRLEQSGHMVIDAGATAYVATVHTDSGSTSVALGDADRASGAKAQTDMEFQIGSATKTFTAAIVLRLVGRGVLALDDSVEHWLPGLVPNGENITIRMLLQHTSGLFDYTADEAFARSLFTDPTRHHSPQELLAVAFRHDPTFAPGKGWAYSNTGYVVAGLVAEKASGQSMTTLIGEQIAIPLGLEHTYWNEDAQFRDANHLHGYYRDKPGGSTYTDVSGYSVSWANAAGAVVSTLGDLGEFERALQSGRVLKPEQLQQMRTTIDIPGTDGKYAYGLGLMRITTDDGFVWGHTGGSLGYLTQAWASADGHRSLVQNVPTGASTPQGQDTELEDAASKAASDMFDLIAG